MQFPTSTGTDGNKFRVSSEFEAHFWVVDASMFLESEAKGPIFYEDFCTCGKPACSKVGCKHVKKVLRTTDEVQKVVLKPWLSTNAWEKQVGNPWEPIDAHEMADAVQYLQVWSKPNNH